jgi:hypothetical protein
MSSGLTWTAAGETNYFVWEATSLDGWSEAKALCQEATPTGYIINGVRPHRGTVGIKGKYITGVDKWTAYAYVAASYLVLECSTQLEHSVDYYFKAKAYGAGSYSNSAFNPGAHTLSTNCLLVYSGEGLSFNGIITNSSFFDVTFPAAFWCDEPETNRTESAGFDIINEDAVLKWEFNYCKDEIE